MILSLQVMARHTWFGLKEHLRQPGYYVPTLLFPAMFFLFFALPEAKDDTRGRVLLSSFSAFAVIGVVFFQFAVGTASERLSTWNQFLRSLPVDRFESLMARSTVSLIFASMACLVVWGVVLWTTAVRVDWLRAIEFWLCLSLGAIPFALLGAIVGQLASPKGAVPLGNLIYLGLSYVGGLWYPPAALPEAIQQISPYVPTRPYAELLWDVLLERPMQWEMAWQLLAYSVGFALLLKLNPVVNRHFRLRGV